MTANQINYFKAQEDVRHNKASEDIERRKASASEMSAAGALTRGEAAKLQSSELTRHNQQQEAINWFQAERDAELKRSQASALLEQARASTSQALAAQHQAAVAATNAQTRVGELSESIRHNLIYENENRRHNIVSEDLKNYEVGVQSAKNVKEMSLREQELEPKIVTAAASSAQAQAALKNATTQRIGTIGKLLTDSVTAAARIVPILR